MNILLIDDDDLSRNAVKSFLVEQLGHTVIDFDNGREAFESWELGAGRQIVISDIKMPYMTGIELIEKIRSHEKGKDTYFIMITGYADTDSAIRAIKAGVFDFLQKPINVEELAGILSRIERDMGRLEIATTSGASPVTTNYTQVHGIGHVGVFSSVMRSIMAFCDKLHEDRAIPVLIEGETGTGKEIVARKIHYGDNEDKRPFVSLNCSAITSTLFESELFGYEEGAFTGAKKTGQMGKLELANGGTLFLDEIGDIPLDLQPKLLRALQEKEIYRVGGTKTIKLDVRFICASNKRLDDLVEKGLFRSDLYYRLNVAKIFIPNLSERKEEIMPLAKMFLYQFSEMKKKRFNSFSKQAIQMLEKHDWRGNIRELQNTIERLVLLYDDFEVKAEHLSFLKTDDMILQNVIELGKITLPEGGLNLHDLEKEIIQKALKKHDGNQSKTAEYLGISRGALRTKMGK
jgi:DNA-binding NtrC family response regulator